MNNNGESILVASVSALEAPAVVEEKSVEAPSDLEEQEEDASGMPEEEEEDLVVEEEEDLTPEEGDVLQAGDHLIELEIERACPREVLADGLRRMGFSEVLLDQSAPSVPSAPSRSRVREQRFVGRLARSISVHQLAEARWTYARRLRTDILSELKLKFTDHPLSSGKIYEARFLSRMRSQPTRPMVEIDLHEMGWDVLKLSALRRDMRIPGRASASVTLWFAVLRWVGADSYVSEDDPFYFEDVIPSSPGTDDKGA